MEPVDLYIRAARHRWWVALAGAVVGLGIALLATASQTPVYSASATSSVVPSPEVEETTDIIRSLETLERRTVVATFAMIAEARETRDRAGRLLGPAGDSLAGYRVAAAVVPSTNIIRIRVEGPDPERASRLANALAEATAAETRSLYRIFGMQPLQRATPETAPVRPSPARNYVVGAIAGLFLGILLALALEFLRPSAGPVHTGGSRDPEVRRPAAVG